jgi:hypothetical protein
MKLEGGCYCGKVRYLAEGEPTLKAQCHCRECQYISGGAPNMFVLMPPGGFKYTKGTPKTFTRSDLEKPVTREFCAECGTHLVTRRPGLPAVILKVGTLDDPSLFGEHAQMAIYSRGQASRSTASPTACQPSSACHTKRSSWLLPCAGRADASWQQPVYDQREPRSLHCVGWR